MTLRFPADRRALLWSLGLFPALPALAFFVPRLAPWLIPFNLYLAYCAGVLTHNHNHTPTFHGKRANALYAAWLSFFYGSPIFVWIPTHNQNHHRYLNGPGDATETGRFSSKNTLWAALSYPTRSAFAQAPAIWAYARAAAGDNPRRFRHILQETAAVALGHAALFSLAVAWHGLAVGALVYGCALGLPALFASWAMMFTNYVQHVGCDPSSADDHSRNFVSPVMNWLLFDAGFHTVHHEHAGTHWSRYPELHQQRAARIDPRLNERSIFGYCFRTYLLEPIRGARASSVSDSTLQRT